MAQEGKIKDIGALANDTFVGHADEAVLSLKSAVHTPMMALDAPKTNQNLSLYMSQLTESSNSLAKPKQALRLSYDEQLNASQQDQLFSQINDTNLEGLDQNDIVPFNEFES